MEQPIVLEDLFAERCVLEAKGQQQVGYVLLIGEAGTGKSTVARKLAYIWAMQRGFCEVFVVYVLLVHKLKSGHYDNRDNCFHAETLATAVTWECFP